MQYSGAMRIVLTLIFLLIAVLPLQAANSTRNFGGVGIDGIPRADGQIVVRQLVTGGPAQQAGVQINDIITHIDGKPTRGSDFKQMVDFRLRGKAGTKVAITVHRPGETRPRKLILVRRQLVLSTPEGITR